MRIGQMNPQSDVKLWDESSKARQALFGRMSDEHQAAWKEHVDPRLATFREAIPRGGTHAVVLSALFEGLFAVRGIGGRQRRQIAEGISTTAGSRRIRSCLHERSGFLPGEHGWFDKRFMYEESLRTPLVVAGREW